MCQRVPPILHAAWMESLMCAIGGTCGMERVKTFYKNKLIIFLICILQNYFFGLYPAKILDLSRESFFPCNLNKIILKFASASKFLDTSADISNWSFRIWSHGV